MQVDLTKLLLHQVEYLEIKDNVIIPENYLTNTLISKLSDVTISGELIINEEEEIVLTGKLSGTMTLLNDITLEPIEYNFNTSLEENLDNLQNILDITDILWQNILVEIPSKVGNTLEENYPSGDGWRVISEETFEKERNITDNPFQDLGKILDIKEEK